MRLRLPRGPLTHAPARVFESARAKDRLMAGGLNAVAVMCLHCAGKATRTSEGIENDLYRCEECGGTFGIDWSRGQPQQPCWPPTPAELEQARRAIARRKPG